VIFSPELVEASAENLRHHLEYIGYYGSTVTGTVSVHKQKAEVRYDVIPGKRFRIGDIIRFGDTEGEVVEKNMLVTRIRTRKNELVTIPNSNMMSSQTSNFSSSAQKHGVIVHTKVTIGYDEPWKKIERLLLDAAEATDGIKKHPKPFVIVSSLDDFYVEYEINGFTDRARTLPIVYSTLHSNILDHFHRAGVEIMSPHIEARRDDLPLQIPPSDDDK